MEPYLGKKYVQVSSENYDEYLTFMGFGYLNRKAALVLRPVNWLIRNDDQNYTLNFTSKLVNWSINFTPGVEFDQTRPDGAKLKSVASVEDNKMIHKQTEDSGRVSTHVYEFLPDRMTLTTTATGFDKTMIRRFELVK